MLAASIGASLAGFGNLAKGIDFLYGYYGDQGLFKDATTGKTLKVAYKAQDDGYDAARTIPNIDEMLDSEKDFAVSCHGAAPSTPTWSSR